MTCCRMRLQRMRRFKQTVSRGEIDADDLREYNSFKAKDRKQQLNDNLIKDPSCQLASEALFFLETRAKEKETKTRDAVNGLPWRVFCRKEYSNNYAKYRQAVLCFCCCCCRVAECPSKEMLKWVVKCCCCCCCLLLRNVQAKRCSNGFSLLLLLLLLVVVGWMVIHHLDGSITEAAATTAAITTATATISTTTAITADCRSVGCRHDLS